MTAANYSQAIVYFTKTLETMPYQLQQLAANDIRC